MPLSQIMELWETISFDKELFSAIDLSREIRLCKRAENLIEDKMILFDFVSIPFNDNKLPLLHLWDKLIRSVAKGNKTIDTDKLLNVHNCGTLEGLEIMYRKSDLLYYYCSRFCREELDNIIEIKHIISTKITDSLQELRQNSLITAS